MIRRYFAADEETGVARTAGTAGTTTPVVKTEAGAEEKQHEATIPYERFTEVNLKAAEATKLAATLQAQLDKIATDKKTADEKALAEQGKFKELATAKDLELTSLKTAVSEAKIINEVLKAAATAGAIDPDAVVAMLDKSKVTIVDGKVTGAKEAVDELLKTKPYLIAQTGSGYRMGAGGGITNPSAAEVDGMTPEQYRAWRKLHPDV
jgi:hypothetical protein